MRSATLPRRFRGSRAYPQAPRPRFWHVARPLKQKTAVAPGHGLNSRPKRGIILNADALTVSDPPTATFSVGIIPQKGDAVPHELLPAALKSQAPSSELTNLNGTDLMVGKQFVSTATGLFFQGMAHGLDQLEEKMTVGFNLERLESKQDTLSALEQVLLGILADMAGSKSPIRQGMLKIRLTTCKGEIAKVFQSCQPDVKRAEINSTVDEMVAQLSKYAEHLGDDSYVWRNGHWAKKPS